MGEDTCSDGGFSEESFEEIEVDWKVCFVAVVDPIVCCCC